MKIPILLPKIFDFPFTYQNDTCENLIPGDFVKVPFGSNEITGVVWPYEQKTEKKFKIKKISRKINVKNLNSSMIEFITWFSKYNLVPLGMSFKMCLLNKDVIEKNFEKDFIKFEIKKNKNNFLLSNEQKKSLEYITSIGNNYNVTVLEGVTGSGKTLVYFHRIKNIIDRGFQALILLPEIALTKQFSTRFKEFFNAEPAIWHSDTTRKNKSIIWKGISEGKIQIVIGARSSLFLPFKNLGIIIVDEEQDVSYKQDEGVSYNARDMAITRASLENIPINLVTSIPSVETYNNIVNKKYHVTKLEKRFFKKAAMPNFEIINLRSEKINKEKWIAKSTIDKVNHYLDKGDQVLFFLNRRGYAPFVICNNCGIKFECPNCAVNLNFHKKINKLLCHYCGHKSLLSRTCKKQGKCDLIFCGPGVERIFSELKKLYPKKKIEIFSSDTLKNKYSSSLFKKVEKKKIDILIGTQLLSKGFHFPKLNCIVVVDGNFSSHGYDLRSAEKNIQLYHQLAGRAGREGNKSSIFFQTYTPEDDTLLRISKNDPHAFLEKELLLRKEKKLPPFYRLISLIISGDSEILIMKFATNIKSKLPKIKEINVLGPVLAPITKIRKKYRCRILIRYPKNLFIQKYLSHSLNKIKIMPGIKLEVDVDPINFG